MSILQNAIDSIHIGVEDYQFVDQRRNLSVVRNISAGLLLLYKEKLCRLSPKDDDKLLISKEFCFIITADGELKIESKGIRTVDVHAIKDRFQSLKVKVNWKSFHEINKLRNSLEHYYITESPAVVREILSKSFVLIHNFLTYELDEEPRNLLGENCWNALLNITDVYNEEHKSCTNSLSKIDWIYTTVANATEELRCQICHSELIKAANYCGKYPEINLLCSSCGHTFIFSDVLSQCVAGHLFGETYIAITDGGEPPYNICHECGEDTFIFEEGCCVSCGCGMKYSECLVCGTNLGLEDQEHGGICSYHAYVADKARRH